MTTITAQPTKKRTDPDGKSPKQFANEFGIDC